MKDFSRKREEIVFTIDEDRFEAAPALPGDILTEFAVRFADENADDAKARFEQWTAALELVLLPDSYKLFRARLRDKERPIELEQASEVIVWLLEQYGLRPTQPSSLSPDGPPNPASGTSSTDAPLREVSNSALSLPAAS